MFQLRVSDHFSAAHRLRGYRGRCENMHGHNYRVEACLEGERLDDGGLLVDFGILKKKLKSVLSRLDHLVLNRLAFFRRHNPSAENLARYLHRELGRSLRRLPVRLRSVTVWESENSSASYSE